MNSSRFPMTFPTVVVPDFSHGVVQDVCNHLNVSYELGISTMFGVMSESAQGYADVQTPGGPVVSLSLWMLILAEPGDGKSPTLRLLRRPIIELEAEHVRLHVDALAMHSTDMLAWQAEQDEILSGIKKAVRKDEPAEPFKQRLAIHAQQKPKKPRLRKLTYCDITPQALHYGLAHNWPHAAVVSDEASQFFNGRGANDLGALNQAWDGSNIVVDRRGEDGSFTVEDPRITLLQMIQRGPLTRYFRRRGMEIRENGTLSRCLITEPPSLQGNRYFNGELPLSNFLPLFHSRVKGFMDASIDENGDPIKTRKLLVFSEAAKELFISTQNDIERALLPGGLLFQAKDYAAKIMRNIAKIAGLLHLFEYGMDVDEISLDTLDRAISISRWYVDEFLRLFTAPPEISQELQDAEKLYQWMFNQACRNGNRYLLKSELLKNAPYGLRKKETVEALLNVLMFQQHRITGYTLGKINYYDMDTVAPYDSNALQAAIDVSRAKRSKPKNT